MNRKLKNTLSLVGVLAGILALGFAFIFIFQKPKIKKKKKELTDLRAYEYDTKTLKDQLAEKTRRANQLDSILAARKFIIPKSLKPVKYYEFMNDVNRYFSEHAKINIEYLETKSERDFFLHEYKVTGYGTFNDIYQLVFAHEQSKELKKIRTVNLSNYIVVQDDADSKYLVSFAFTVDVYYSQDDRFATSNFNENELKTSVKYDIFYPLIRTSVPPNTEALLDVQNARLLALVPEGAFISDSKGESYLLMEGDKVYLGYLTKIDFQKSKVRFVLNKGGIVESVELELEKERIEKDKQAPGGQPK